MTDDEKGGEEKRGRTHGPEDLSDSPGDWPRRGGVVVGTVNMAAVRPPLVRQRRDVTRISPYGCATRGVTTCRTRARLPAGGERFPGRVDPRLHHHLSLPALVPGDIATRGHLRKRENMTVWLVTRVTDV